MRHRASRPFYDRWHCLPRATARLLGAMANGPLRAMAALVVMLGLATGAVGTAVSAGGPAGSDTDSAGAAPRLGETSAPDAAWSSPELFVSGEPSPGSRSPEAGGSADGQPKKRLAASETPTLLGELGEATGSRSPRAVAPSPTPSQSSAAAPSTPQDVTPPQTSLSAQFPSADAATFSFGADESASFTCSLDGAAYTPCDSATSYEDLDPGWHTFAVRARDTAGNVDPSPATTRWQVKGGRPKGR